MLELYVFNIDGLASCWVEFANNNTTCARNSYLRRADVIFSGCKRNMPSCAIAFVFGRIFFCSRNTSFRMSSFHRTTTNILICRQPKWRKLKKYVHALRCGDGILASMDVLYLDSMRKQGVIFTNKRHKRHFRRKRSHRLSLSNVSMKYFAKYQMYGCLMANIHMPPNNNLYLIPL